MPKTSVNKNCENCSVTFFISLSDSNRGRGRFCGKSCAASGKNNSSYKHGNAQRQHRSRTYSSWASMHSRLKDEGYHAYNRYSGRGIKVCERWNDFKNFLNDMGERPQNTTLDRINNDGDYTPENCRWATLKEQGANKSNSKVIEFRGVKNIQEEWGRITGLGGLTIYKRLKRGWTVEKTLTTPRIK